MGDNNHRATSLSTLKGRPTVQTVGRPLMDDAAHPANPANPANPNVDPKGSTYKVTSRR